MALKMCKLELNLLVSKIKNQLRVTTEDVAKFLNVSRVELYNALKGFKNRFRLFQA